MNLPDKIYTEKDVSRAKASGKMVGWIQGAGVVVAGAIVLNLLGWIPVVLGVGAAGWVLYKMMSGSEDEGAEL